ncbi:hypothetical protein [Pseudomonas phage K4]|nr:hypothetical protein [Pseudomonas phage IME180]QWS69985.1 hypothetical protein [Pseudomonas phage K4]
MGKVYILFEEIDEFGLAEVLYVYRTLTKAMEDANHFNEMGKTCYVEEFNLID